MLHTISNSHLTVTVSQTGAELWSVQDRAGTEYLWQGDAAYWGDRAPVLFPIIGRLEGKTYRTGGQEYPMDIHGFAAGADFTVTSRQPDALVLTLTDTPATRERYPYAFRLEITYRLRGDTLQIQNRVENTGDATMHFSLGGHPGFRVPLEAEDAFTDYCLTFASVCDPDRIGFTADSVLVNGQTERFSLENGTRLSLDHGLFDRDAIILQNMARQVSLHDAAGPRVTVSYPDMSYLGIWHWPHTDAPYVCIEPWTSLPGRSGVTEDIGCRSDYVHLASGASWENTWSIQITERRA